MQEERRSGLREERAPNSKAAKRKSSNQEKRLRAEKPRSFWAIDIMLCYIMISGRGAGDALPRRRGRGRCCGCAAPPDRARTRDCAPALRTSLPPTCPPAVLALTCLLTVLTAGARKRGCCVAGQHRGREWRPKTGEVKASHLSGEWSVGGDVHPSLQLRSVKRGRRRLRSFCFGGGAPALGSARLRT